MLFERFDPVQKVRPLTNTIKPITIDFNDGEVMEGIEEKEIIVKDNQNDNEQDSIFKTQEIIIEEMAIDGICGVY